MIIEWIFNALIAIIKLPISLLNIPSVELTSVANSFLTYCTAGLGIITFFITPASFVIIGIDIGVMALFKIADLVGTIVGFFKKTS